MAQISDKISTIEKELDLQSFTFRGENVWPIIRIGIYLSSTKTTHASAFSYGNAIRFLLEGALLFFYNRIASWFGSKNLDSVIVTSSHYKVKEGNQVHDRIIDPVVNYLQAKNSRFSVWEFTAKYKYDTNISYRSFLRPVQKELYFLSFIRKLNRLRKKSVLQGDVTKLNALLAAHDISFRVDGGFSNKLEVIFSQAQFFQKILKAQRVKSVFVVAYYDVKCFSVLLAANRLGLRSVDLQHGVQGQNHMAYARWPKEIFSTSNFLPTHFYVWDENSKQTIARWKPETENILLGCNKWFLDRAKKISNDLILLTLQPIDDFLPDYVIKIIQDYQGDKMWAIRLHPRQMGDMAKVEERLAKAGLSAKTEVKNASTVPLTSLLERTAIHTTYYSSVAIEASYYNIPTYFLGEEYLIHYTSYLDSELIYCYPGHDISNVITEISREGAITSRKGEDRVNVLDTFVNGK